MHGLISAVVCLAAFLSARASQCINGPCGEIMYYSIIVSTGYFIFLPDVLLQVLGMISVVYRSIKLHLNITFVISLVVKTIRIFPFMVCTVYPVDLTP